MYVSSASAFTNMPSATTPPPQRQLWDGKSWFLGDGILQRCKVGDQVVDVSYKDYIDNLNYQIDWTHAQLEPSQARLENSTATLAAGEIEESSSRKPTPEQITEEINRLHSKREEAREQLFHIAHNVSQNYHRRDFHEKWSYHHLTELQKEFEAVQASIIENAHKLEQMEKDLQPITDPEKLQKKADAIEPQKKKIKELEGQRARIIDAKIGFLQHLQKFGAPLKFPQMWIPKPEDPV